MAKCILSLQELSCNEKSNNEKSSNKEDICKKSSFTYADKNNCNHELYSPDHILNLCRSKSHKRTNRNRRKRCVNCGCRFYPERHILNQKYCSKKECQRVRGNTWRRYKLKYDQDYRDNRKAAQRKWKLLHPDYWKNYKKRIINGETSSIRMRRKEKFNKIDFKAPTLRILVAKSTLIKLRKTKAINCICRLSCSKL